MSEVPLNGGVLEEAGPTGQQHILTQLPRFLDLPFVGKLLALPQVHDLYRSVCSAPASYRLEALLEETKIALEVPSSDLARVPTKGGLVAIANHPVSVIEATALAVQLARVRSDVRILTNSVLASIPELQPHCFFVDPFHSALLGSKNLRSLELATECLRNGGALVVFAASEVLRIDIRQGQMSDPAWKTLAARLVRQTAAAALPVHFCGRKRTVFHIPGLINQQLSTVMLLQEFLQHREKAIQIRIGNPIPSALLTSLDSDEEASEYLRLRADLLSHRGKNPVSLTSQVRAALPRKPQHAIISEVPRRFVIDDIAALPGDRLLAENAEFALYCARGRELPHLLDELGRLREITFRAAGEGTGQSSDVDSFDLYYWHLLLWHKQKQELAGAYRAGNTDEIIRAHGIRGLYTHTVFRYDERLFLKIGSALELGRSFVRTEYQRHYAPLLLLWKGIARFVAGHPETPTLFGAVSISREYSSLSREMMVRYFEQREDGREFAELIQPRTPFRAHRLRRSDCAAICGALRNLEELAEPISDLEEDGKGLPILLKQYAKLGGKLIAFNLDRRFSDVVDGLVIVDLRETEPALLDRYMGEAGHQAFRRFHGLQAVPG